MSNIVNPNEINIEMGNNNRQNNRRELNNMSNTQKRAMNEEIQSMFEHSNAAQSSRKVNENIHNPTKEKEATEQILKKSAEEARRIDANTQKSIKEAIASDTQYPSYKQRR